MRMKKTGFALIVFSFLLSSCSHKQASTKAERLAWQNLTLTNAYETVGSRNPKWDEPARKAVAEFARARAGADDAESGVGLAGEFAQEACNAGCDDPLIRYLYCRFSPDHSSKPLEYWQDQFRKAAQGMESSGYSPLLKFYANDRAANELWQSRNKDLWQEIVQFRRAAMGDLTVALQDKTLPIEDVSAACDALIDTISANDTEMTDAYKQIEGPLFKNWPDSAAAYFIKGKFYYRFAWIARGGGYADKVTPEAWKDFKEKLAVAETAYRKAWSLNPHDVRIPNQMIEMAVSQEKPRPEMELWFQRAMQLDTNNYDACLAKLRYLKPEWYGSRDEMLAFGRECVATNWGGRVPFTLVEAHRACAASLPRQEARAYWHQPDVWADVQSAYEKFFQMNPDDKRNRYYYARYAFICGQAQAFNAQVKLIRDNDGTVDTAFFGGDESFNKMVGLANGGVTNN
jgi:hypothetical protein